MSHIAKQFYESFKRRLEDETDLEFIASFNREVGNPGTGTARMAYLAAIRQEFKDRNINISSISKNGGVSYKNRIALYKLNDRKFVLPL